MTQGGMFVTLYDRETLKLYLEHGVYGQHMSPEEAEPSSYSNHYRTLADFACGRAGDHVFFFHDRHIFYGGQLLGSKEHGAFFLNGRRSPLGREGYASLVWDESRRTRYDSVERGLFMVDSEDEEENAVCQPFLFRFEDERNLAGVHIESDQLYFELAEYPYPLPANTISGRGFCRLTPGETRTILKLIETAPEGRIEAKSDESVALRDEPVPYSPTFDVDSPWKANPESQLEASVTANPSLLPESMRPDSATVCRQVPISPFKPRNIDQADVCYYSEQSIRDRTVPSTIIELKNVQAGKDAATQVVRYLDWLYERLGSDAAEIDLYVYAPSFSRTFNDYLPKAHADQIEKMGFAGNEP